MTIGSVQPDPGCATGTDEGPKVCAGVRIESFEVAVCPAVLFRDGYERSSPYVVEMHDRVPGVPVHWLLPEHTPVRRADREDLASSGAGPHNAASYDGPTEIETARTFKAPQQLFRHWPTAHSGCCHQCWRSTRLLHGPSDQTPPPRRHSTTPHRWPHPPRATKHSRTTNSHSKRPLPWERYPDRK